MTITRKMQLLMISGLATALFSLFMVKDGVDRQVALFHAERARAITQTALGIVASFHLQYQQGLLSEAEAKDRAAKSLRAMRYGKGNADYMYVLDQDGHMVVHPVRPDWEGRDVSDARDMNNVPLFPLIRDNALQGSAGFSYQMSRGRDQHEQNKIAFAQHFAPWGWYVTTGSFDDELRASYWKMAERFLWSQAPLIVVLVVVVVWVSLRVARPLRFLAKATDQIRCKNYDVALSGGERHDEIGLLTRSLMELRVAAKDADELRRQRELAAKVFDTSHEGIVITDAEGVILTVNPAFERISGYAADDVVGATPSVWQSGLHDAAFYAKMWDDLESCGRWEGEIHNRRGDGSITVVQQTIYRVKDERGVAVNHVAVQRDVTEVRRQQDRIEFLAYHDCLTGLPNRSLLLDRLSHAVNAAQRNDEKLAVMFLDLDRFKAVNDTLGHDVGDDVLRRMGERLSLVVRGADTVARMGGDEFVVLMERLDDATQITQTIERVLTALSDPMHLSGGTVHCPPSIGIAVFPEDGDTPLALLKNADTAMYAAKSAGGNTYSFFSAELSEKAATRFQIESGLRTALGANQFQLHFQPKLCMKSGRTTGAEALLRWVHPQNGLVSPAQFIPLAEEVGLIGEMGHWVLGEACRVMADWPRDLTGHLKVAVNVSAQQLIDGFPDMVSEQLAKHGLAPHRLELEVTESSVMGNPERIIAILGELRRRGFTIAVDDFGTGYSSLSYLKHLPIDVLKIDRAFVTNAVDDPTDGEIVGTIIALARALKLSTVAEGVENEEQWRFLRRAGCGLSQGFLHGRPMPASDFLQWLHLRDEVEPLLGQPEQTSLQG